jgi:hypothetical protein
MQTYSFRIHNTGRKYTRDEGRKVQTIDEVRTLLTTVRVAKLQFRKLLQL